MDVAWEALKNQLIIHFVSAYTILKTTCLKEIKLLLNKTRQSNNERAMNFNKVIENFSTTGLRLDNVAQYLIQENDIDHRDKDGWTLLHFAAQDTNAEVVRLLTSKGAALNFQCEQGWTALHNAVDSDIDSAIQSDHTVTLNTAKALIEAGASEDILNNKGKTPRDGAAGYGQKALDLYDMISKKSSTDQPTLAEFATDCCETIMKAGFDVRMTEGGQISVAEDHLGHEKPSYHFYILSSGYYASRRDPKFRQALVADIRDGFESSKKLRGGK